jgi:hypothetical protein
MRNFRARREDFEGLHALKYAESVLNARILARQIGRLKNSLKRGGSSMKTKFFASFALAVTAFGFAPQALMAGPLCPLLDATKQGTYVVSGTGTAIGFGPAAAVGVITYDGHGNTLATFTVNVAGNVATHTDVPGTYTIHSDCTGTTVEAGAHYSFVTSPDGNTTTWIETDAGSVFSGTEVRLKPVEEAAEQVHSSQRPAWPASRSIVAAGRRSASSIYKT